MELAPHLHASICTVPQGRVSYSEAIEFVSDPAFGGIAVFEGRVRASNLGRTVTGISYDLFDALALREFGRILTETEAAWGPQIRLWISHAKGRLAIGETAVVVAAGTPHRDAAFRACRDLIEAVKHHAPIWKQEHFVDGDSQWSEGCSLCPQPMHAAHQLPSVESPSGAPHQRSTPARSAVLSLVRPGNVRP